MKQKDIPDTVPAGIYRTYDFLAIANTQNTKHDITHMRVGAHRLGQHLRTLEGKKANKITLSLGKTGGRGGEGKSVQSKKSSSHGGGEDISSKRSHRTPQEKQPRSKADSGTSGYKGRENGSSKVCVFSVFVVCCVLCGGSCGCVWWVLGVCFNGWPAGRCSCYCSGSTVLCVAVRSSGGRREFWFCLFLVQSKFRRQFSPNVLSFVRTWPMGFNRVRWSGWRC